MKRILWQFTRIKGLFTVFRNLTDSQKGLVYMIVASIMFSLTWALVYAGQMRSMATTSLVASGVRILTNLIVVLSILGISQNYRAIFGDLRLSLWLRGFFGSAAMICTFFAIKHVGIGEASFLRASNGLFIAALAPVILRQRTSLVAWCAITGGLLGLALLCEPRFAATENVARLVGMGSGLISALAYMMISKAGRDVNTHTVVFYFCFISVIVHALIFPFIEVLWPSDPWYWIYLVLSGLCASIAQFYLTKAYTQTAAALNVAVSYLNPVLNLVLGIILFQQVPDDQAFLGVLLVLVFGTSLPFVDARRPRPV